MESYSIRRLAPGEAVDWEKVEKAGISRCPWPEYPTLYPSFAQLAAAQDGLWVRLCAQEEAPVARHHALNELVCQDSCLEFFFQPCVEQTRYFNFEFNCEGVMFLGIGGARESNAKLFPEEDYRQLFRVRPFESEAGWGVEFFVPLAFVQRYFPALACFPGRMKGNFYKCGDETPRPHYQCWNEVEAPAPDFHRPEYFGALTLA